MQVDAVTKYARGLLFLASVTGLVLAGVVLWFAVDVLFLGFAGILLAILLRTLSVWLSQLTYLNERWALVVVCLLLAALGAVVCWLLAGRLAQQVSLLAEQLPAAFRSLQQRIEQYGWGTWLLDYDFPTRLQPKLAQRTPQFVSTTLGAIISIFIVLFVGVYLALEPMTYRRGFLHLFPVSRRARMEQVLDEAAIALRRWLIGRVVAMFTVALMTWFGLWLLGIPLAVTLGLLAGFLDFIPNFGPILASFPAVMLALLQGANTVVYVVLLYLSVQLLESYLLTPLIQRQAVKLPPALTILWQILFGLLFGLMGLMLATPILAACIVAIRILYVEDTLGDHGASQ